MAYKTLVLEENEGVATVTFISPTNRITMELLNELKDALMRVRGEVLVLAAKENFSMGSDLEALAAVDRQGFYALAERGQDVCSLLEGSPRLTIAALTGYTLGPGLEIALACDFRVAADSAVVGFPEVKVGLLPAFGSTGRLLALLGPSRAKRLLLTGALVHAEEAQWMGLVDEVTGSPLARAQKLGASLGPGRAAIPATKRLLTQASLSEERNAFAACCTEETKAKMNAFLAGKKS